MTDRNGQHPQQPTPRVQRAQAVQAVQAVQAAADACDQHATNGDTVTLHTMQRTVQAALNLGVSPDDIRQARTAATR